MTKLVLKEEGISGFYGGVTGVMIGQGETEFITTIFFNMHRSQYVHGSLSDRTNYCFLELTGFIKAVAFSSNSWALAALAGGGTPTLETLCVASCFSGMLPTVHRS